MTCTQTATNALEEIFDRVTSDLAMLSDRAIRVLDVGYEEREDRPAGPDCVHVSFRFGIVYSAAEIHHGALIVPLPTAISLAAYLMMTPDERVREMAAKDTIDGPVKEAMLEVGNFVAGAADAALRGAGVIFERACFEGCQGVQANVRPRLDYVEGDRLCVGRAQVKVAGNDPVEIVAMLPKRAFGAAA